MNAVGLKFLERRLCQRVHSAVCSRPAANRIRPAGHEKPPFLGPGYVDDEITRSLVFVMSPVMHIIQ